VYDLVLGLFHGTAKDFMSGIRALSKSLIRYRRTGFHKLHIQFANFVINCQTGLQTFQNSIHLYLQSSLLQRTFWKSRRAILLMAGKNRTINIELANLLIRLDEIFKLFQRASANETA